MPKIRVHEKALAHLSRGLYRSPASALRELVSNAWDANAKEVRIDTGYPNFTLLSIEDDGAGFTRAEFVQLMEGGIGNSQKRPQSEALISGRPIIGRLGIGMLGIAQICGSFEVISRPRRGAGFRAKVRLFDLLRERLDEADDEIVAPSEVDVGVYDFEKFEPSKFPYGTTILSDDIHPTFAGSFQRSLTFENFKEPPREWRDCLKVFSGVRSLQELGDYWRLLWELSAACPVPYLDANAVPSRLVAREQERLLAYKFAVKVDGRPLHKPVLLHGNQGGYTTIGLSRERARIYGRPVSFHGYLVVQEGAQLKPDELRGILIRVRDVGIGYYDPSLLDYRFNEGPRSRWLTGEIFVDEGLENALNIDRDSFNRFHPEFRFIQERVHEILQKQVFPVSYKKIKVRSSARAASRREVRDSSLRALIQETVHQPVHFSHRAVSDDEALVSIDQRAKHLSVAMPERDSLPTKRAQRDLAAAILTIFEVAEREGSRERRRMVFTQLLLDLLRSW